MSRIPNLLLLASGCYGIAQRGGARLGLVASYLMHRTLTLWDLVGVMCITVGAHVLLLRS